jgi:hypothetical protein
MARSRSLVSWLTSARGLGCRPGRVKLVGRTSWLSLDYLRERIAAFPDLTAVRLNREIKERGYGAYIRA